MEIFKSKNEDYGILCSSKTEGDMGGKTMCSSQTRKNILHRGFSYSLLLYTMWAGIYYCPENGNG